MCVGLLPNRLLEQLNVEADRPHEEVDVLQTVGCECWRQGLGEADGVHDTILDSNDKSLLLVRAGTNTDSGEKLPDVGILIGGNATRENVRKSGLEDVEELSVGHVPVEIISVEFMSHETMNIEELTKNANPVHCLRHYA